VVDGVKRSVAAQASDTVKQRIRQIARRTCRRSLDDVAPELRRYISDCKAHFQLVQTPGVLRSLDAWRPCLRALQLKHC